MTLFKSLQKKSSTEQTSSCELNLLQPDVYGVLEEGERKASLIRTVFIGIALVVWVMVALRAWEIRVIAVERKSDELEMTRISRQIEKVDAKLSVIPKQVREAREEISMQVDWAQRLSNISSLVPEGCVFGPYSIRKDGTMQFSGYAREPWVYAQVLDALSEAEFVKGIKSASLIEKQGHYEFRIIIATYMLSRNN